MYEKKVKMGPMASSSATLNGNKIMLFPHRSLQLSGAYISIKKKRIFFTCQRNFENVLETIITFMI
jgi:hypothetical protein